MRSFNDIELIRTGGNLSALSDLVLELFGYKLNTKCSICVNDAKMLLLNYQSKKQKTMGKNFIWKGGSDKKVVINVGGVVKLVNAKNCTEADAMVIASIPKYSHLVEVVAPIADDFLEEVNMGEENPNELQATILTSIEATKEEPIVKKKKGRPFSKSNG